MKSHALGRALPSPLFARVFVYGKLGDVTQGVRRNFRILDATPGTVSIRKDLLLLVELSPSARRPPIPPRTRGAVPIRKALPKYLRVRLVPATAKKRSVLQDEALSCPSRNMRR